MPTISYDICENRVGSRDQGKLREPTEDHRMRLIALQSRIRRKIIRFIGVGSKKALKR